MYLVEVQVAGHRVGGLRRIAGQHDDARHANFRQRPQQLARLRANDVGDTNQTDETVAYAHVQDRFTVLTHGCGRIQRLGRNRQSELLQQAPAADQQTIATHVGSHAASDQQLTFFVFGDLQLALAGVADHGQAQRVWRMQLAAGGQTQQLLRARMRIDRDDPSDAWPAGGQRAGLVEDDSIDVRGALQRDAAFDQYSAAGGVPDRRAHRRRRRQSGRARTRDDQHGDAAADVTRQHEDKPGQKEGDGYEST